MKKTVSKIPGGNQTSPDNVFQRTNPTLLTYLIPGKARVLAVFDEKIKNADYYPNTSANASKIIERNKNFKDFSPVPTQALHPPSFF